MILIQTTHAAAPAVAYALGDTLEPEQRLWISRSVDVRAAKEAVALAGDERAIVIHLNGFGAGLLTGCAAAVLWAVLFHLAQPYGRLLSSQMRGAEPVAPAVVHASKEPAQ